MSLASAQESPPDAEAQPEAVDPSIAESCEAEAIEPSIAESAAEAIEPSITASTEAEEREAVRAGTVAFEMGYYDAAAQHFRRAYRLSARAELLYRLGLSELRAGRQERALEAFQTYLRLSEEGAFRDDAIQRIQTLEPQEAEERELAIEAEDGSAELRPEGRSHFAPDDESPNSGARVLGLGGVVVGALGATMLIAAAKGAREVRRTPDGTLWSDVESDASRAERRWAIGWVMLGLGAAAGVGAVVVALRSEDDDRELSLRVGVGAMTLRGSF